MVSQELSKAGTASFEKSRDADGRSESSGASTPKGPASSAGSGTATPKAVTYIGSPKAPSGANETEDDDVSLPPQSAGSENSGAPPTS